MFSLLPSWQMIFVLMICLCFFFLDMPSTTKNEVLYPVSFVFNIFLTLMYVDLSVTKYKHDYFAVILQ